MANQLRCSECTLPGLMPLAAAGPAGKRPRSPTELCLIDPKRIQLPAGCLRLLDSSAWAAVRQQAGQLQHAAAPPVVAVTVRHKGTYDLAAGRNDVLISWLAAALTENMISASVEPPSVADCTTEPQQPTQTAHGTTDPPGAERVTYDGKWTTG